MTEFQALVRELHDRSVRFLVIGVWGANYYAQSAGGVFTTQDRDLFVPPDPENLLRAWQACEARDFALYCGREPLDVPRDRWLADKVVSQRALTRAHLPTELEIDFTLVMGDFDFEQVWPARRSFVDEGVTIPVARLIHIVASKAAAGRPKDRLFLETHQDVLRNLMRVDSPSENPDPD